MILAFLQFLNKEGSSLSTLTRSNISAFVEYEQDRGLKAISIISQLTVVYAFINYLVRQEVIAPEVMKPKVRIQQPDALPKAIPREDIELILDAITSVRDRALIMLLLRTGMRIGELLEVKLEDIVLHDQKILIYVGSKNYEGRGQTILRAYVAAWGALNGSLCRHQLKTIFHFFNARGSVMGDHDDNIFDEDDALDYIMSEEAESWGTGELPQPQAGCLGLITILALPAGLVYFGISLFQYFAG